MDNIKKYIMILETEKQNPTKQELIDILFKHKSIRRYILGRNESAKKLSEIITADAYIDDYTDNKTYLGKPILSTKDIEKVSIVVSSSLAIYPHSAINSLKNAEVKNILDYLEVAKYSNNTQLTMDFIDNACIDLQTNYKKYENIYNKMVENKSKKVFINLLNFRKNKNLSYLKDYKVDPVGQYFEYFCDLKDNEVFIDAGGFDGHTSIEFIKHCPKYKSVYIFEPDKKNLELTKKNLTNFKNINFISKGLSDQKDILKFNTVSGSSSSISENGCSEIEIDTLDSQVKESVTFIKIDIEGMKAHILNDHPKMAISVYHKVDDFWKIPEKILAIRDDYDLYMRHYTEGTDETVMFFIPRVA